MRYCRAKGPAFLRECLPQIVSRDIIILMEHDEHTEERAAETNAEPKKDRFLPISILIAAVVIGGSVLFASLYHPAAQSTAGTGGDSGATSTATLTPAQIMTLGPRDAILGSPNAPVTMIEYGDYQCPFCGMFFSQTEPEIVQNYVNTGKVKMVFRNFPFLGPESTAAAEAAECAEDQNKLWVYHDALYQAKVNDVARGGSEDDGYFTNALFLSLAQKLDLDMPTFTNCVDNNLDSSTVATDVTNASAAGVNSTPTFFINGTEVSGAEPYATFSQVIDAALKS